MHTAQKAYIEADAACRALGKNLYSTDTGARLSMARHAAFLALVAWGRGVVTSTSHFNQVGSAEQKKIRDMFDRAAGDFIPPSLKGELADILCRMEG